MMEKFFIEVVKFTPAQLVQSVTPSKSLINMKIINGLALKEIVNPVNGLLLIMAPRNQTFLTLSNKVLILKNAVDLRKLSPT